MPTFAFVTADVFTKQRFGGNQLAVFPDAQGIDPALMQRIAREFNFSETTFVLPPSDPKHTRRVRIFTPGSELPFAGHPTVGTAFVLATVGAIELDGPETRIVFEQGVGPVPVTIRAENGRPGFAQLTAAVLPEFTPAPVARDLAHALGLDAGDVLEGKFGPEGASCGVPFLFVPVRNRATLGRARVRLDDFEKLLAAYGTQKVFVFCDEPELKGSHFRARMFAPGIGVPEDPATGSAVAAFAGYLAKRDERRDGTLRWVIEQGFEMGRPSILEAEADVRKGAVTAIRVGGHSVLVTRGELTV
ncbi:MAG: PhzF family phenazine biosynthesis protein [Gemmatimonadaceae bacterium]